MFPEHNKIKVEISNRKIQGKFLSIWNLNNNISK